ncbi:unnamed protein product [Brachionus calyciflorus]|uniref:Apple domain-containing protein n=1 Tax=Brachionus calyciflorus TaxID=104777 RepID=A0A813X0N8_9BILA|nr:unnamed protein product [Brachionus calyciflorus]
MIFFLKIFGCIISLVQSASLGYFYLKLLNRDGHNYNGVLKSMNFRNRFECFSSCNKLEQCAMVFYFGNNCRLFDQNGGAPGNNSFLWKKMSFINTKNQSFSSPEPSQIIIPNISTT